jgi:hypothetical protein
MQKSLYMSSNWMLAINFEESLDEIGSSVELGGGA